MAKYNIGKFEFPTKKAARERCSQILRGTLFEKIEGEDADLLTEILGIHAWRKSIQGNCGVAFFCLVPTDFGGTQVKAIRTDGSEAAFPLTRIFEKRNPSKLENFKKNCRRAIAHQIINFKKQQFRYNPTVICQITQEPIGWDDTHIDHIYPFECMLRDWLKEHPEDYSKESVQGFAEYHYQNARLRCVSKAANLSRTDDRCTDDSFSSNPV